jgi:hypothetical protein
MSLTVSKVGPYFSSGSISFSQLRSNFKETSSSAVSASELLRVTDLTNTNPIVPDATENANIATSQNLKLSQFRNSIKYYDLNQGSGDTDLNLDIASSSLWNSNLGKNIVKRVNLAGTSASSNGNAAASLIASAVYNVILNISGSILGTGGASGGGNGGNALSINTNNTGTVIVKTIGSSSKVYGGGGGGGNSGSGGRGGGGYYIEYYTYYGYSADTGEQTGLSGAYYQQCDQACKRIGPNYWWDSNCYKTLNQYPTTCGDSRPTCWSIEAQGKARVSNCRFSATGSNTYFTSGGNGGSAQAGGLGQGYGQNKSFGIRVSGFAGGTNAGTGGNSGKSGDGGNWGQDGTDGENGVKGTDGNASVAPNIGSGGGPTYGSSKGTAGRAVAGSGYIIDPNSVSSAYLGLK